MLTTPFQALAQLMGSTPSQISHRNFIYPSHTGTLNSPVLRSSPIFNKVGASLLQFSINCLKLSAILSRLAFLFTLLKHKQRLKFVHTKLEL